MQGDGILSLPFKNMDVCVSTEPAHLPIRSIAPHISALDAADLHHANKSSIGNGAPRPIQSLASPWEDLYHVLCFEARLNASIREMNGNG